MIRIKLIGLRDYNGFTKYKQEHFYADSYEIIEEDKKIGYVYTNKFCEEEISLKINELVDAVNKLVDKPDQYTMDMIRKQRGL